MLILINSYSPIKTTPTSHQWTKRSLRTSNNCKMQNQLADHIIRGLISHTGAKEVLQCATSSKNSGSSITHQTNIFSNFSDLLKLWRTEWKRKRTEEGNRVAVDETSKCSGGCPQGTVSVIGPCEIFSL